MSTTIGGLRVELARTVSKTLLAGNETRWRHTIGVATRAREVAATVPPDDRETLIAAAWLHDVGYSEELVVTGFHPLDGAVFLARAGWSPRIAALVAHHSGANIVAGFNGMRHLLAAFPQETGAVADALTYADQTTGPVGQRVDIRTRLAEVLRRHGPDSVQARAYSTRAPSLIEIVDRVDDRLAAITTFAYRG